MFAGWKSMHIANFIATAKLPRRILLILYSYQQFPVSSPLPSFWGPLHILSPFTGMLVPSLFFRSQLKLFFWRASPHYHQVPSLFPPISWANTHCLFQVLVSDVPHSTLYQRGLPKRPVGSCPPLHNANKKSPVSSVWHVQPLLISPTRHVLVVISRLFSTLPCAFESPHTEGNARKTGFWIPEFHLRTLWPQTNYLTFLRLSFPMSKMGIIIFSFKTHQ